MKPPFCVLTIAGSDSGAGAGVQADARTIHALGGFATMAVTTITAQNTRGVEACHSVPPGMIAAQLDAVLGDLHIRAIKTGLLPDARTVRVIARRLAKFPRLPVVVDPVLCSTSGTPFLDAAGVRALKRELLPRATLATPNWPEAATLSGNPVLTLADAEASAQMLAAECGCAVLVKGGHATGDVCGDCLVTADGRTRWFSDARIATRNTHGTGCVLSAAIATELARGADVTTAVARARLFLRQALRRGRRATWGGAGPAFAGSARRPAAAATPRREQR